MADLCKHLESLPVGMHNLTLSAGPFVCPWCEIDRLRDALGRIKWTKDCGIDGRDESGKMVNFAADERDAMYRIACEALPKVGL